MKKYQFKGWFNRWQKNEVTFPWEKFEVVIRDIGTEIILSGREMERILSLSGYQIILKKRGK